MYEKTSLVPGDFHLEIHNLPIMGFIPNQHN